MRRLAPVLAVLACACVTTVKEVPQLGNAAVVADFDSYRIRRVGVAPVSGAGVTPEQAQAFQAALFAELSAATPYEILPLSPADLAEIPSVEPYRRGWYRPRTILDIARRFRLDALLIATVTDLEPFPPQRLGVQADLVSCETGQTLWAASLQLDASQQRVRASLEVWANEHLGDVTEGSWEIVAMSPRRFARFAAYQLAILM